MKYKINWCEQKRIEKINKSVLEAELLDENGNPIAGVQLWEDNWPIATLQPGSEVSGDIVTKQKGKFSNKTLYPERTNTLKSPSAPSWATGRKNEIKAAVVEKQKGIHEAQENKQEGIKVSSTFRDATLITVELLHGTTYTEEQFKDKWLSVRNWLWNNYETSEDKQNPPF